MTDKPPAKNPHVPDPTGSADLLPDFCDNQVLLVVLLAAEALAIVLTLSQASALVDIWVSLGNTSFFILIIALVDAALLCYVNRHFHQLSVIARSLLLYLILQLVTVFVTLLAYRLLAFLEFQGVSQYTLFQALVRNLSISLIITGVMLRYFYVRHQTRFRRKAEELARIQALQARIRPHFLFNSLNTIASLVHSAPDRAEDAILDLAELFRSTLTKTTHITLGEELDIVNRYLHIEQLRLGKRLQITQNIADDVMEIAMPALLIQPLVENAVYHGIEPLADGGVIDISAWREADSLKLKISNPCDENVSSRRTTGNHLALDNIRQRLTLAYAKQAGLQLDRSENLFSVTISLPIQSD